MIKPDKEQKSRPFDLLDNLQIEKLRQKISLYLSHSAEISNSGAILLSLYHTLNHPFFLAYYSHLTMAVYKNKQCKLTLPRNNSQCKNLPSLKLAWHIVWNEGNIFIDWLAFLHQIICIFHAGSNSAPHPQSPLLNIRV